MNGLSKSFAGLIPQTLASKVLQANGLGGMAFSGMQTIGDPTKPPPIPQDELNKFGNWTGQTDTKVMAADLKRRGLIGADQLLTDNPKNTAEGIRNAQSDWKPAAIQEILANARKLNLRTPEEINANRDVLISTPKYREAINNPAFSQVHPNFWNILTNSILPEQYAKFSKNITAKK